MLDHTQIRRDINDLYEEIRSLKNQCDNFKYRIKVLECPHKKFKFTRNFHYDKYYHWKECRNCGLKIRLDEKEYYENMLNKDQESAKENRKILNKLNKEKK